MQNINVIGASGIIVTGNPGTNTLTITPNGSIIGQTITGQSGGALSPVAGNWNIFGGSVVAGTSPVVTSGAGNTLTVNVQRSQAIASTNATNIGLAAFNSSFFTVDANGFVSASGTGLGQTITGNTGGALSPTAGNWNILGTATNGIESAGSGSTLTVRMQSPYADADFVFQSTVSAQTRTLTVQNTSNTASSQATQLISVAGTTAGDAWTQYSVGTTQSYAIGISNSNTQELRITQAASGTVNPTSAGTLLQFDESNTRAYFPISNVSVGGSTQSPGAAVILNATNTNTTAASDATITMTVSSATGGNAYVVYNGPTDNWYHGVNKTAGSSAWQLQHSTSATFPSATTFISVSTSGVVDIPNGITFDGTNVMDNFVASTSWTPAIAGASTAGTATYTVQAARYIRIANVVFIMGNVTWNTATGTGNLLLTGLPFTINNTANIIPTSSVRLDSIALPAATVNTVMQGIVNTTTCNFVSDTITGTPSAVQISAAGSIFFSMFYFI